MKDLIKELQPKEQSYIYLPYIPIIIKENDTIKYKLKTEEKIPIDITKDIEEIKEVNKNDRE